MRFIDRCILPLVCVLVFSVLPGCGGAKGVVEKTVPASGVIKLDGKPAGGVHVRSHQSMRRKVSAVHGLSPKMTEAFQ